MLRNPLEAKAKLAHLPDGYPTNKRGFFSFLSNAWEKLAEEVIHHSTCPAGTGLCALLLGPCVSLERSCSPIPHLQFY